MILNDGMQQVVDEFGLEPNRSGFVSCPAHSDSTPSLKLYEDHFNCFSCGANGDEYGLIALLVGEDVRVVLSQRRPWSKADASVPRLNKGDVQRDIVKRYRDLSVAWFKFISEVYKDAPVDIYLRMVGYWSEVFEEYAERIYGKGDEAPTVLEREELLAELAMLLEKSRPTEEKERQRNQYWLRNARKRSTPLFGRAPQEFMEGETHGVVGVVQRGALP